MVPRTQWRVGVRTVEAAQAMSTGQPMWSERRPGSACVGDRCGQSHLVADFEPGVLPSVFVVQLDGVDSKRQPLPQESTAVRRKSAGQVLMAGEWHTGGSSLKKV